MSNLVGSTWDASVGLGTESQYMVAGARVVWKDQSHGASGFEPDVRVTYALPNLIQSTTGVVDLISGELLERTTFYPNGARETLRTNTATLGGAGWGTEPVGFTGKEGDDEVGLTYFGERYLLQHLGRWASPDPLHVHAGGGGEFGNSYHYVSGNLLQVRDPLGLEGEADGGVPAGVADTSHSSDSNEQYTARFNYDDLTLAQRRELAVETADTELHAEAAARFLNDTQSVANDPEGVRDPVVMAYRRQVLADNRGNIDVVGTSDGGKSWVPTLEALTEEQRAVRQRAPELVRLERTRLVQNARREAREAASGPGQLAALGTLVVTIIATLETAGTAGTTSARSRFFAHGALGTDAASIQANGIQPVSVNTHRYLRGSFFTHEVPSASPPATDLGLISAEQWAIWRGAPGNRGVLILEVPEDLVLDLQRRQLMHTGSVPGTVGFAPETVFEPLALPALNAAGKWHYIPYP